MKRITGEKFNTAFGVAVVPNEQNEKIVVGEQILFEDEVFLVREVVPPSTPGGKWSIMI